MSRFVIQKHTKRKTIHYDLMLERSGKLITWQIKKLSSRGVLMEAKKIQDHRLDYLFYQGKVSRGRGRVKIWDKGAYKITGKYSNDYFVVRFSGKKITGPFCFIRGPVKSDIWYLVAG